MRLIFSFIIATSLFCAGIARSQTTMPKADVLTDNDSYKKYERDVLYCIDWLDKNPIGKNDEKSKDAASFVVAWSSGCPYVTMVIDPKTLPFIENSPNMVLYFMGGWARFAIQHPSDTDKVKGTLAGLRSVIKAYKTFPSYTRDKDIDNIVALNENGKLEAWVREQLK